MDIVYSVLILFIDIASFHDFFLALTLTILYTNFKLYSVIIL